MRPHHGASSIRSRGYILLTVVVLLMMVALLAMSMNREAGLAPHAAARERQARQADYLVESALNHAEWEAGQSYCYNYNLPTTNMAGGLGTYSATFTPNNGTPVSIVATATTADGAIRTRARSNVAVTEPPVTLLIQPGGVDANDTWIYEWKPSWAYGASATIKVYDGWNSDGHTLIRFDVSSIPPAATITGATLELYQKFSNATGAAVAVHRITTPWLQRTGTGGTGEPNWDFSGPGTGWSNPGGDFDVGASATTTIPNSTVGWFAFDLTTLVADWVAGTSTNHGVALVPADGSNASLEFHSAEASDPNLRPKLTVTYGCPCGAGGGGGTVTYQPGLAGKDVMLRGTKNYGAAPYTWIDTNVPYHSLFEFDLSEFAPGVIVASATLEIHQSSADVVTAAADLDVHRVTTAWVEGTGGNSGISPSDGADWPTSDGTSNWVSAGGDYDSTVVDSVSVSTIGAQWHAWNVQSLVQDWVNATHPNYGFLLRASSGDITKLYLDSGDDADVSVHPKLTIEYACGCGVPSTSGTLIAQPDAAAGKDTKIFDGQPTVNYATTNALAVKDAGGEDQRALLEFDLSSVPSHAVVTSATLDLAASVVVFGGDITAHRVTAPWDESGATWNEAQAAAPWDAAGGDFIAAAQATQTVSAVGSVSMDITALASAWFGGGEPHHGLLLKAAPGTEVAVASSDNPSPTNHPRLTLQYTCPCGIGCTNTVVPPQLLMVVVDPANLTIEEQAHKTTIEGFGYDVSLIDESAVQSDYDTAVAASDVVFISGEVTPATLGSKLVAATIGVVYEAQGLADEFGIAPTAGWESTTTLTLDDVTHYITETLAEGNLTLFGTAQGTPFVSSLVALGRAELAQNTFGPSLVALNTGAAMYAGGNTAGRRVQLPWGDGVHSVIQLSTDALTILERALAWAAGNGASWEPEPEYLDQFIQNDCTAADYNGSQGALDWSGQSWTEIGDAGDPCNGSVKLKSGGGGYALQISASAGLLRDVDLSPFSTAYLNVRVGRSGFDGDGEYFVFEVWDDPNTTWVEIGRVDGAGSDSGLPQKSYDMSAYISANAKIRMRAVALETVGAGEQVNVDDIHITEAPLGGNMVAHWKLDETAGTVAVDSAGTSNGTVTSPPNWTSGQVDGGLGLDGVDDYVSAGNFDVGGSGLTLSGWFNATTIPTTDPRIISKASGIAVADALWQLSTANVGTDRYMRMRIRAGGTVTELQDATVKLNAAQWYYAVATYDNTSGDMKLYLDGAEIASTVHAVKGAVDTDASVPVAIGANGTPERFFDGVLDDVRVYNKALTATEISDLYAAGGGGAGGGGGVTFAGFTEAKQHLTDTSIVVDKPSGTASGDLLIMTLATDGDTVSSQSPPAGWTLINSASEGGSISFSVWWKLAGASEAADYTISWSGGERAYAMVMRFTGHHPTAPIGVTVAGGGSSISPDSLGVTTTVADTLILRVAGFDDDDITIDDSGIVDHTTISMDESDSSNFAASGGAAYVKQAVAGFSGLRNFALTAKEEYRAVTIGIVPP